MSDIVKANFIKHQDRGLLRFATEHLAKRSRGDYEATHVRMSTWLDNNPHPEDRSQRRHGGRRATAQDVVAHGKLLREHGGVLPLQDPVIRDEYGRELVF